MKTCKRCNLNRVWNELPAGCRPISPLTVAVVAVALGHLFLTWETLA